MREIMEIFPAKLQKLWDSLDLRVLVLLSLFLQIVLISTGNRRKYTRRKWVTIILWLSYLSADAVATLALGLLLQAADSEGSKSKDRYTYAITAFWAPFLLMHLGGPDTITAYSLADNELWSRHLLGLIGQVGVAIYVFLRSWISTPVNYVWVAIFVVGLVKYGERSWVLFCASRDQFRESMVSPPDPGPNYAKFMNELVSKEDEGFQVSLGKVIDIVSSDLVHPGANVVPRVAIEDATILHDAFYFFGTFKRLFADLILSFQDRETSFSFFRSLNWEGAFSIVEIELGLIYDLLYTKAFLRDTSWGFFLRALSCSSTVAALVAFLVIDKSVYPKTEVIITYVLLVGAILIEIYAVVILLSSDRMSIWLSGEWVTVSNLVKRFQLPIASTVCYIVALLRYLHIVPARMRWSNAMRQYNFMNCCLETEPKFAKVHQYVEKYLFWNSVSIPKGLKALIFYELRERVYGNDNESNDGDKKLGGYRGDKVLLQKMNCFDNVDEVEFDQIVLLWHMATDFCYHTDVDEDNKPEETWLSGFIFNPETSSLEDVLKFRREICVLLSNYMMHLLIMSPFMLPSGIGQIRFQDTRAEAIEFFDKQKDISRREACEMLSQVDTRLPPSEVKGDRSKSLLFDACRLAKSLQKLQVSEKWEKITQAWLDILTFAAAQCRWNDHAEKLSQGGELLTHVWLLMAHLGMTDQFQISQGYVRAKLNLK